MFFIFSEERGGGGGGRGGTYPGVRLATDQCHRQEGEHALRLRLRRPTLGGFVLPSAEQVLRTMPTLALALAVRWGVL